MPFETGIMTSNISNDQMKPRLLVIQPLIPHYRFSFFSKLSDIFDISIYSSSSFIDNPKVDKLHTFTPCICFLNLFFFQSKLPFWSSSNYDFVLVNFNPRYISTIFLSILFRISGCLVIDYNHRKSSSSSSLGFAIRNFLGNIFGIKRLFYTRREYIRSLVNSEIRSGFALGFLNNTIDTALVSKFVSPYIPSLRSDFVFIGRLTNKSSFKTLVKALALSDLNYKVHVIGDGSLYQPSIDLAECLHVRDRLVFHGDMVDEMEISNICNKCRCFVYPGDVGLSCIHLMTYGLPGVLHEDYSRHMPEYCAIMDSGITASFPRHSSSALALAMDSLYVSKDSFLIQISDRYRSTIQKAYTIDMMVDRFSGLFDHV